MTNEQEKHFDYRTYRKGTRVPGGYEIDYCPKCGKKGEHVPAHLNASGTVDRREHYVHTATIRLGIRWYGKIHAIDPQEQADHERP